MRDPAAPEPVDPEISQVVSIDKMRDSEVIGIVAECRQQAVKADLLGPWRVAYTLHKPRIGAIAAAWAALEDIGVIRRSR